MVGRNGETLITGLIAAKLSILEEQSLRNTLDARLSAASRFILQHICADFRKVSPYDSALDRVCAS